MNIEGQLEVSVLERNAVLRKLQPEIVFLPRSSVLNPSFCSYLRELGQQNNGSFSLSLFLDSGRVLNSFEGVSPCWFPSAVGGHSRKKGLQLP